MTAFLSAVAVLGFFLLTNVSGDNLLLLGDSVDRLSVTEWCAMKENQGFSTSTTEWGQKTLMYRNRVREVATVFCRTDVASVAAVHIFGSGANGPYLRGVGGNPDSLYEDTKARLSLSIPLYISTFGKPDRIILHTAQVDCEYLLREGASDSEIEELSNNFRENTNLRINEILMIIDESVDFGLRTAVWNVNGGKLLHEFNRVIRDIATKRSLTLYDFDQDVWSTVNHNYTQFTFLFRDWTHPKQTYTARAAEKMLGRQFTNAVTFRNGLMTNDMYNERCDEPLSNLCTIYLWRDIATDTTFFVNNGNRSRHANPDKNFVSALRLGPSDIRHVTGTSLYKRTELGISVPNHFIDRTVFNRSESGDLLFYSQSKLRVVPHISVAIGLGIQRENIIQINNEDSYMLPFIEFDTVPIPYIFSRTEPWLIGKEGESDIYLVKNSARIFLCAESSLIPDRSYGDVTVVDGLDIKLLPLSQESVLK